MTSSRQRLPELAVLIFLVLTSVDIITSIIELLRLLHQQSLAAPDSPLGKYNLGYVLSGNARTIITTACVSLPFAQAIAEKKNLIASTPPWYGFVGLAIVYELLSRGLIGAWFAFALGQGDSAMLSIGMHFMPMTIQLFCIVTSIYIFFSILTKMSNITAEYGSRNLRHIAIATFALLCWFWLLFLWDIAFATGLGFRLVPTVISSDSFWKALMAIDAGCLFFVIPLSLGTLSAFPKHICSADVFRLAPASLCAVALSLLVLIAITIVMAWLGVAVFGEMEFAPGIDFAFFVIFLWLLPSMVLARKICTWLLRYPVARPDQAADVSPTISPLFSEGDHL